MTDFYVGTKIVMAWHEERDGVAGYAVKYSDGYTSWSPADKFEEAYLSIGTQHQAPHQQRVVGEFVQNQARLEKLNKFIDGEVFASLDPAEQERLRKQSVLMHELGKVLNDRIAAF